MTTPDAANTRATATPASATPASATPASAKRGVHQLRVVVQVDDLDTAAAFFRDALGLPERAAFSGEGDARVILLEAGQATLELANAAQVRMIDRVETDGVTSPRIRLAFEVDDAVVATAALEAAGGVVLASPRETPWRSRNARVQAPEDLQLTLFEEFDDVEHWAGSLSSEPAS